MKRVPSWSTRPTLHRHRKPHRHSRIKRLEPRHLLAAGEPDLSFGKIVTDLTGSMQADGANDVAVQSDGKIVAVGFSNTGPDAGRGRRSQFAVARFNPDGSPTRLDSAQVVRYTSPLVATETTSPRALPFNPTEKSWSPVRRSIRQRDSLNSPWPGLKSMGPTMRCLMSSRWLTNSQPRVCNWKGFRTCPLAETIESLWREPR